MRLYSDQLAWGPARMASTDREREHFLDLKRKKEEEESQKESVLSVDERARKRREEAAKAEHDEKKRTMLSRQMNHFGGRSAASRVMTKTGKGTRVHREPNSAFLYTEDTSNGDTTYSERTSGDSNYSMFNESTSSATAESVSAADPAPLVEVIKNKLRKSVSSARDSADSSSSSDQAESIAFIASAKSPCPVLTPEVPPTLYTPADIVTPERGSITRSSSQPLPLSTTSGVRVVKKKPTTPPSPPPAHIMSSVSTEERQRVSRCNSLKEAALTIPPPIYTPPPQYTPPCPAPVYVEVEVATTRPLPPRPTSGKN